MAKVKEKNPAATTKPPPLIPITQWEQAQVPEFGGNADILSLESGQCAGPLTYSGHQSITTDLGTTTAHLAVDREGDSWRLPINATFIKAMDQANMAVGDTFLIARQDDVVKKRGAGAGKPMAIYAIKVLGRANKQ